MTQIPWDAESSHEGCRRRPAINCKLIKILRLLIARRGEMYIACGFIIVITLNDRCIPIQIGLVCLAWHKIVLWWLVLSRVVISQ
ncbi:hypothetical protein CSQ90_27145 [Janthinobacterium sp. BJB303]|nr:hypothetical protein CSQ90_27145 [Janthinobacterium sp. BJB303]